jgi:hypothetical protein
MANFFRWSVLQTVHKKVISAGIPSSIPSRVARSSIGHSFALAIGDRKHASDLFSLMVR